jgi:uncharacterized phage-associated protein
MDNQKTIQSYQPTASDVAKYLLEKKGTLTGFQLQKLLYYCQAWSLTVEDKPLFAEDIRAFENGPDITSVSMQHQGRYYVHASNITGDSDKLSASERVFIDEVLDAYGKLTGDQLVELTHQEGPWRQAFNGHTSMSASAVISKDSMRAYYARLLTSSNEHQKRHHVPEFDLPKRMYVTSRDYDWLLSYLDEEE